MDSRQWWVHTCAAGVRRMALGVELSFAAHVLHDDRAVANTAAVPRRMRRHCARFESAPHACARSSREAL